MKKREIEIKFDWENEEQRARRFMAIPPKKKLELLQDLVEFLKKYAPRHAQRARKVLR